LTARAVDPLAHREEIDAYDLPVPTERHFPAGGDHDWQAPKRHLQTQSTLIDQAVGHVVRRLGASE